MTRPDGRRPAADDDRSHPTDDFADGRAHPTADDGDHWLLTHDVDDFLARAGGFLRSRPAPPRTPCN